MQSIPYESATQNAKASGTIIPAARTGHWSEMLGRQVTHFIFPMK